MNTGFLGPAVATAPTVYGIETRNVSNCLSYFLLVATAPTVYGIETQKISAEERAKIQGCNSTYRLRY